jgi:hypothetical protein
VDLLFPIGSSFLHFIMLLCTQRSVRLVAFVCTMEMQADLLSGVRRCRSMELVAFVCTMEMQADLLSGVRTCSHRGMATMTSRDDEGSGGKVTMPKKR